MDEEKMALTRMEQLLQENLEISQQTQLMLREMRRLTRLGFWFRVLMWAAVIVVPLLLLKPLLNSLIPVTSSESSPCFSSLGLPCKSDLQHAFGAYLGRDTTP